MNKAARLVLVILGIYLLANALTNCYLAVTKGITDKNLIDAAKDVVIGLLAMLARVGPDPVQPPPEQKPGQIAVPAQTLDVGAESLKEEP